MNWTDELQTAADDIFDLAGESVTYTTVAGEVYSPVAAVCRSLTADDLISDHVQADSIICQVREWELAEAGMTADPGRGDIITREISLATSQELEVVERRRDSSGIWNLTCQQRIRVTP